MENMIDNMPECIYIYEPHENNVAKANTETYKLLSKYSHELRNIEDHESQTL